MNRSLRSRAYAFVTFPYRVLRWMMVARPIRFTRFGTFYILFTLGVGAAAINTGNNLLYLILGILLGFIAISGFLSDSAHWGIQTEWTPIGSLYAGEKALMEGRLTKGRFPGVAITVESRWHNDASDMVLSFVPWIPSRGETSVRLHLTPIRRGYLTLESCHYSTRFPFGLFQKSHRETFDERWIVYPKLQRLPLDLMERRGRDPSPRPSQRTGSGSLPLVLRDYRMGDALRQVHWKVSAKRQRLIVKETEEESGEGDLFYLAAWPTLNDFGTESFISFIASLIFSVHECGRPTGLATPERLFQPEHSRPQLHRILEYLALVDPGLNREKPAPRLPVEWTSRVTDILPLWKSYESSR